MVGQARAGIEVSGEWNNMKKLLTKIWVKLFRIKGQRTSMIVTASCPRCGNYDTERCHHSGTFAVPECFFTRCDDCGHQWDHN